MYLICRADVNSRTPAYLNYLSGMKNKVTGKPLYKLASHLIKDS